MKRHPTVAELKAFLNTVPDDMQCYGYEGEGGSHIIFVEADNTKRYTKEGRYMEFGTDEEER